MLIAMTGLHAAGKSYFTNTIPQKFGFEVYNKKELLAQICKSETGRLDWNIWYKEEFKKDPYQITEKIIQQLPKNKNKILDAVHSYNEWKIIKNIDSSSLLAIVTTPRYIRSERWENDDDIKDIQRIKYWHSIYGEEIGCLLAEADWSFNGAASQKINEQSFKELISLNKKARYISRKSTINLNLFRQKNKMEKQNGNS